MTFTARSTTAFDFSRLRFPTDRLTVADLRSAYPESFVGLEPVFFEDDDGQSRAFQELIRNERYLAYMAHARLNHLPDPYAGGSYEVDREELVGMIDHGYRSLGLSTGIEATRQLVRDIESQVEALDRAMLRNSGGPGPVR